MVCWHSFKALHVDDTTHFQSLIYLCLVFSGCFKQRSKFPCGNSIFRVQTLTCYLHRTISTWGKSEKFIHAWLHRISNKSIKAPGCPPFLTLHHLPTLEASNHPTKNYCFSKNCTQFDSLQSDLIHKIVMCHFYE